MPNMAREFDALFAEPDPPLIVESKSLELMDSFFDELESTKVKTSEKEDSDDALEDTNNASDFNKYDVFEAK